MPPLGAMLELPAAVERLPELADVGDFFSLGTNDLTASTLGLARTDPQHGTPALAGHPDVLSQVERAVAVTAAAGRPLSVCGDAAADPAVLPLLLQAGVRSVSVAPSRLDAVRELVRRCCVGRPRQVGVRCVRRPSVGSGSGARRGRGTPREPSRRPPARAAPWPAAAAAVRPGPTTPRDPTARPPWS